MQILRGNEFMSLLRGLNFWTLKQKIKDHTTQRVSTIQLLYKIDIYENFTQAERLYIKSISDPKEQQKYIRTHGRLSKTTGEMKSHSFVLQFQQIMIEYMLARPYAGTNVNTLTQTASVRDYNNTLQQLTSTFYYSPQPSYANYFIPAVDSPNGITTYGVLAGTGTTAPTTTDYKMQTLIANGTSTGQLQYEATSIGSAGVVGANTDTILARVLVNGSGATITITEVGVMVSMFNASYTQCYFLIAHDAVNQAVNNGAVAVVSYDIRTTT